MYKRQPLPASKAVLSSWRLVVVCALITTGVTGLASKYPAGTYALTHLVFFFVPMFSGWHKSKEANYDIRLWLFSSVMPKIMVAMRHHLVRRSCLCWSSLRKKANSGGRLCRFLTAMRPVCLGRSWYGSYRKLWHLLCPPKGSGPCISQPTLMLFKYLARSQCPASILPGL